MINLGLTPAERAIFEQTLIQSHRIRVRALILDRNEKATDKLTGLLSGAVQIDAKADVTRSLTLSLAEPRRILRFEPNSPSSGALYADNSIAVSYGVWVSALAQWVDVPVFWGPLTMLERAGGEVRIEAQGKERLMLAPHYAGRGYTVPGKTRIDDAVTRVARESGEARISLPDLPLRLPRPRVVGPESEPWKVIKGGESNSKGDPIPGLLDRGARNLVPFYDGAGYLTTYDRLSSSIFTFREGDEQTERRGHLLDEPTIRYDTGEFRNTVIVRGGKRKKKPRAEGRASLPGAHPLSPAALARNGSPRYLIEFVDADGLKTDALCTARARELLDVLSREGVSAAFNSLPVPHLEEGDTVTVRTDAYSIDFPLSEATIPLTPTDSMAVGGTKPVRR